MNGTRRGTKDHVVRRGKEERREGGVINWQTEGVCDAPGWRLQAALSISSSRRKEEEEDGGGGGWRWRMG